MTERWGDWEAIEQAQARAEQVDADRYRRQAPAEPPRRSEATSSTALPADVPHGSVAEGLRRLADAVLRA
ncbi:MAG: hypothetical protein M3N29_09930, partial [Chloroflexota bacterium]|nr:hypothetical protein [Chloroflexota bacterium]